MAGNILDVFNYFFFGYDSNIYSLYFNVSFVCSTCWNFALFWISRASFFFLEYVK